MNIECAKCRHAENRLNGRYCTKVDHYVEHTITMPCEASQCVTRAKCRRCIWHRDMMMGEVWCDLHHSEIKAISDCNTYSATRKTI